MENINLQNVNIGGNGFEAAGLVGLSGGTIQGSLCQRFCKLELLSQRRTLAWSFGR